MISKADMNKAYELIRQAQEDTDFHATYNGNVFATGDRSVDYQAYWFDINDDYALVLSFSDFSFDDFSIMYKNHIHYFKEQEEANLRDIESNHE